MAPEAIKRNMLVLLLYVLLFGILFSLCFEYKDIMINSAPVFGMTLIGCREFVSEDSIQRQFHHIFYNKGLSS
jgi:hypothetical protein